MIRKTTKEILVESFIELSHTKSVDKITIQQITDNCQLSPATFYRYFSDKYDLIAWEYTRHFDERFQTIDKNYTYREYTLETIIYSWEHKEYLINLINNTTGYQSYIQYVTNNTIENYLNSIKKIHGEDVITDDLKLFLRYSIYGSIQLVYAWINEEFQSTPEHLTDIICQSVIDPLKPYL